MIYEKPARTPAFFMAVLIIAADGFQMAFKGVRIGVASGPAARAHLLRAGSVSVESGLL